MTWDRDRLDTLTAMRRRRLTFGICARLLGVTRGAAIGAYHRELKRRLARDPSGMDAHAADFHNPPAFPAGERERHGRVAALVAPPVVKVFHRERHERPDGGERRVLN